MTKISKAFNHGKAFIPFIVGGDPSIEVTERLIPEMARAGADLIEIGLPFSDPIAEGLVIQDANERALKGGCTTDKLFDALKRATKTVNVPIVLLSYLNPILTYGKERFISRCCECGISGIIVPDMPFEEKKELDQICKKHGVEIISMVSPTSKERIKKISKNSEGFLYCVSSMGVTGVRDEISTDIGEIVEAIKSNSDIPVAVGFGISTPEQAKHIATLSDGVIIGSAVVRIVEKFGDECIEPVCEYIRKIKKSVCEV